jgi:hypothetical protein
MKVERFSNGDGIYIPTNQWPYYVGNNRDGEGYSEFIRRLTEANKVALLLTVDGAGQYWMKFQLTGSISALTKIGALSLPANAKLNDSGNHWECNSGYTKSGNQCVEVKSPANATPKGDSAPQRSTPRESGDTQQLGGDITPRLPANAKLNYSGHDWECNRGYDRKGNECVEVKLPANAPINYSGHGWECNHGYDRSGNECVAVIIPENASLNYSGHGWECNRGYDRSGNECVAVKLPANASLNHSGHGWECNRGYDRSGNECVTVKLPANASLNYSGHGWECNRGYRRSGNECVPVGLSVGGK